MISKSPNRNADSHLPLTPILHPWMRGLLANTTLITEGLQRFGSPLNIHCLDPMVTNIASFREVLNRHQLRHRIYFARKANKCLSLARESAKQGQGVDTASYRELKQCLDAGIAPDVLICTAAVKNAELIELCLKKEVVIVIDNDDECALVQRMASELGIQAQVNVRVSGFKFEGAILHSRFGFPIDEAYALIADQMGGGNRYSSLRYSGLHFHLNGYSVEQRGEAVLQCLRLADALADRQIQTNSIDIGGGYLMNYLQHGSEWSAFLGQLREAALGLRPPLTYGNDPLGMVVVDGKLHGEPSIYPYYNTLNKACFLDAVLRYPDGNGQTAAELLRQRGIELRMEPGRSLLDQVGVTVAQVAFRRKDTSGELLVGLEMNRTQLRSSSADFLVDPIHIPLLQQEGEVSVYDGYLVGSYCLEQELILKRKIRFNGYPQVGDIFVFPNTAGYLMHFYESEAHLFSLAANVIFDPHTNHLVPDAQWET